MDVRGTIPSKCQHVDSVYSVQWHTPHLCVQALTSIASAAAEVGTFRGQLEKEGVRLVCKSILAIGGCASRDCAKSFFFAQSKGRTADRCPGSQRRACFEQPQEYARWP